MDEIAEPIPTYDFTKLTCISPSSITGGNYFIRILKSPGQKPFYIQPPKCTTKQGIMKTGKKLVCDLLFRHEDESFTEFLEGLETYCRTQLFEHKDKWFDSDLTETDIEESFSPTAKLFKSGKLHSVRVNIPIRLGKCSLKVFNEEEEDVSMESISETTQIMTILEVQGIRCSTRNFQLELEVKQMMTMNQVNLFETCLLTTTKSTLGIKHAEKTSTSTTSASEAPTSEAPSSEAPTSEAPSSEAPSSEAPSSEVITLARDLKNTQDNKDDVEEDFDLETKLQEEEEEKEKEKEKEVVLQESLADSDLFLDEVDLEMPKEKGEMKLKKRNYVYYNMYKEAKRKARIARDFAIASYLEAKQIRNNFLDEADLSEEDDDDKLGNELEVLEKNSETNVFRGFNP